MKSTFKLAGIIVALILLAQFTAAEDWTMFRHDPEHTGETSDVIEKS